MTATAENLISIFDNLPEPEKREVATVILRRILDFDLPPLSDDELVLSAEQLFIELGPPRGRRCLILITAKFGW